MEEINDVGQLKGRHSIADKITITATNAELGTTIQLEAGSQHWGRGSI